MPRRYTIPEQRNAIEQFSIDYDVPLSLAVRLIGATEAETDENIRVFVDYLKSVVTAHNDYLQDHGWPLMGDFKPIGEKINESNLTEIQSVAPETTAARAGRNEQDRDGICQIPRLLEVAGNY